MTRLRQSAAFGSTLAFLVAIGCGSDGVSTTPAGPGNGKGGTNASGQGGGSAGNAGDPQGGGGATNGPVRVANMNVRNLFNDKIDSGNVLGEADSTPTPAVYQAKLAAVASILALTQADIIALQEVENDAALTDLATRQELGKAYPHRVLIPGNDPRGIDVAVMSARPIKNTISHKDDLFTSSASTQKYKYSRDVLEVHFDMGKTELVLLVVHFKAKVDDDPNKRLAEAEHTRGIADAIKMQTPNAAVLVLGDFNDFPGSPPINAIEGKGDVFPSMALLLGPTDAWSTEYNKQKLLHDDQHPSPALAALLQAGSVKIVHDDELATPAMKDASDHAPVAATYVFPLTDPGQRQPEGVSQSGAENCSRKA